LLEASLNRQVGNQLLAAKRALYAQSGYTLTRAVAGEADDAWSPAALARRQAHMARRAAHVWRSDFE